QTKEHNMATTTTKTPNTGDTTQQAKGAAASGIDKVKDAAQSGAEKAKDYAQAGAEKVKEAASAGIEKAKEMAQSAGHMAENATPRVGSGRESPAATSRHNAPHEGFTGSAASTVADSLEKGGRYLREEGLSGMAEDLTNTIRRNPLPSILVAMAVGFL